MMMAAALSGMLFLQGCKNAELEDREFPVLLAIRGAGEFGRQWLEYEQSGSKKIDYHHLKAVLIERSFLEDEKSMERMLALLEKDTRIPWNAYVFVTDRCETMLAAEEKLPVPLGEYLEQMTENTSPVKPEKVPTIGKLYKERKNRQETLFLPYVEMLDGAPVVTACEVWKRGSAKGLFDTDTAYASYLIQNAMDTDTLQLAGQYFVKITHPVCRIKLCKRQKTDGRTGRYVKVSVGGEGMLLNDSVGSGDMTTDEMLDRKVREYLQRTAEEALSQEVDVTNSFKKIGAQQRDWYGIYENAPLQYEKDITIQFEVKIHWKKE